MNKRFRWETERFQRSGVYAGIQIGAAQVAQKIGFTMPGIGQPQKKKSTPQELNALRNALFEKFGSPG